MWVFIIVLAQNDKEKEVFKRSFISSFSSSFIMAGGNVDLLRDWKIKEENSNRTIVETITPLIDKLYITLHNRDNRWRMSSISYLSRTEIELMEKRISGLKKEALNSIFKGRNN